MPSARWHRAGAIIRHSTLGRPRTPTASMADAADAAGPDLPGFTALPIGASPSSLRRGVRDQQHRRRLCRRRRELQWDDRAGLRSARGQRQRHRQFGGGLGPIGGNTLPATSGTIGVLGTSLDSGTSFNIGVFGVAQAGTRASGFTAPGNPAGLASEASSVTTDEWRSLLRRHHGIGVKSFIEPHPTDPALEIAYVALEGTEAGTYFRGRARVQNGLARIAVPEDFRLVSEDAGLSIQAMPIGEMATFAVMRIDLNEVVVKAPATSSSSTRSTGSAKGAPAFSRFGRTSISGRRRRPTRCGTGHPRCARGWSRTER